MLPVRSDWLNRSRVQAYSAILLALQASLLIFMILFQHGAFVPISESLTSDFVSFYAAGKLVLAGTPFLAYDQAVHYAAEVAATKPGIDYLFFFYPPPFLLVCAAVATLPYMVAFIVFQAATLAAWLLVMRRILGEPGWSWCIPVLAFPAVLWNVGLGQNAFLTAALMGGFTLLLDKRPLAAGILLGLMCYKPHLAILVPILLLLGGQYKTFVAAAATVAAVAALTVVLLGPGIWQAYLSAFQDSGDVYENGVIDLAGYVTPFGAARSLGVATQAARWLQTVASVLGTLAVGWVWRNNREAAVRCAALAAGSLICVPVALVYDLMLLTISIAWLVRNGWDHGWRPWEKMALLACVGLSLSSYGLGRRLGFPAGVVAPVVLLAVCLARTRDSVRQAPGWCAAAINAVE